MKKVKKTQFMLSIKEPQRTNQAVLLLFVSLISGATLRVSSELFISQVTQRLEQFT